MGLIKDRVTIVERIYHQRKAEQPSDFSKPPLEMYLDSSEQPYERELLLREDWQRLDTGWLKDQTSVFIIYNREKASTDPNSSLVEVAYGVSTSETAEIGPPSGSERGFLVPPGFSMRAISSDARALFLRAKQGEVRIYLTVLPK